MHCYKIIRLRFIFFYVFVLNPDWLGMKLALLSERLYIPRLHRSHCTLFASLNGTSQMQTLCLLTPCNLGVTRSYEEFSITNRLGYYVQVNRQTRAITSHLPKPE